MRFWPCSARPGRIPRWRSRWTRHQHLRLPRRPLRPGHAGRPQPPRHHHRQRARLHLDPSAHRRVLEGLSAHGQETRFPSVVGKWGIDATKPVPYRAAERKELRTRLADRLGPGEAQRLPVLTRGARAGCPVLAALAKGGLRRSTSFPAPHLRLHWRKVGVFAVAHIRPVRAARLSSFQANMVPLHPRRELDKPERPRSAFNFSNRRKETNHDHDAVGKLRAVARAALAALSSDRCPASAGNCAAALVLYLVPDVLLDGIFAVMAGLRTRHKQLALGTLVLVGGIVGIIAGVFMLLAPAIAALALATVVAAWLVVSVGAL